MNIMSATKIEQVVTCKLLQLHHVQLLLRLSNNKVYTAARIPIWHKGSGTEILYLHKTRIKIENLI